MVNEGKVVKYVGMGKYNEKKGKYEMIGEQGIIESEVRIKCMERTFEKTIEKTNNSCGIYDEFNGFVLAYLFFASNEYIVITLSKNNSPFVKRLAMKLCEDVETEYLRNRPAKVDSLLKNKLAWANNQENDVIGNCQNELRIINSMMTNVIGKALERGEKLDQIEGRAQLLEETSVEFKTIAKRINNSTKKRALLIIFVIALLFFIAIAFFFGLAYTYTCLFLIPNKSLSPMKCFFEIFIPQ